MSSSKVIEIPLIEATNETLEGYGYLVNNYKDSEIEIVTWPKQGWREIEEGTGENLLGMLCRIRMSCCGRVLFLEFSKSSNSLAKITSAVWCLFADTAFLIAATSG